MTPRHFLLCIFALFLGLVAPRGLAAGQPEIVPDGIFIGLVPGTDPQSYFTPVEMSRLTIYQSLKDIYFLKFISFTENEIYKEIERRLRDSRVKFAEPNGIIRIPEIPGNTVGVSLTPVIPPGLYVGTVRVRRELTAEHLSDQYSARAQARVVEDGTVTILTNVPESPSSAAESNPAIKVQTNIIQANGINCLVDGQYPGKFTAQGTSLKLTYSVTSTGDGTTTPAQVTRTYEFSLRKKAE